MLCFVLKLNELLICSEYFVEIFLNTEEFYMNKTLFKLLTTRSSDRLIVLIRDIGKIAQNRNFYQNKCTFTIYKTFCEHKNTQANAYNSTSSFNRTSVLLLIMISFRNGRKLFLFLIRKQFLKMSLHAMVYF